MLKTIGLSIFSAVLTHLYIKHSEQILKNLEERALAKLIAENVTLNSVEEFKSTIAIRDAGNALQQPSDNACQLKITDLKDQLAQQQLDYSNQCCK